MTRIIAPIPASCYTCSSIAYCSVICREADTELHFVECKILGPLWCSEISITCILALRAIIQRPLSEQIKFMDRINKKSGPSRTLPYKGSDCEALYDLGKIITIEKICLASANIFPGKSFRLKFNFTFDSISICDIMKILKRMNSSYSKRDIYSF